VPGDLTWGLSSSSGCRCATGRLQPPSSSSWPPPSRPSCSPSREEPQASYLPPPSKLSPLSNLPFSSLLLVHSPLPGYATGRRRQCLEVYKHQSATSQEMRSLFSTESQEIIGIGNILPRQQPKSDPLGNRDSRPKQTESLINSVNGLLRCDPPKRRKDPSIFCGKTVSSEL